MKKLFLVSMLCLTFTIPVKADFWKKLKNAVIGTDATSSSNSSGKTGGTRGYLVTDGNYKKIVNPFDKNNYRDEDDIYAAERNSIYTHRDLQGISEKVNYVECRMKPGGFLYEIGSETFYGYVKFPVYWTHGSNILGCFERDKSGKEQEIQRDIYFDHNLAMYIWDNQLTVQTLAMKNGKVAKTQSPFYDSKYPYFDSQNPGTEIFINGQKVNIK